MAHAHFTRTLVIGGWAVALLVMPLAWSEPARACVIFVKSSVAVSPMIDQCTGGPTEEDPVSDSDQKTPADDDVAAANQAAVVLWSSSEDRLQTPAVNVPGKHNATGGVGADAVDIAASGAADDQAPGRVPGQHESS